MACEPASEAEWPPTGCVNVPLFALEDDLEDDAAYEVCAGGLLCAAVSDTVAPLYLDADDLVLGRGEAALVPAYAALRAPNASEQVDIATNTCSPLRAFNSLWNGTEGFVLVANFSQPLVQLERDDVVGVAWISPAGALQDVPGSSTGGGSSAFGRASCRCCDRPSAIAAPWCA